MKWKNKEEIRIEKLEREDYLIDMEYFLHEYKEHEPTVALFIQFMLERRFKYYDIKYMNDIICEIVKIFPNYTEDEDGLLEAERGAEFFPYSVSAKLKGDEKNE